VVRVHGPAVLSDALLAAQRPGSYSDRRFGWGCVPGHPILPLATRCADDAGWPPRTGGSGTLSTPK